jgi:anti-sigma B factor antagonist
MVPSVEPSPDQVWWPVTLDGDIDIARRPELERIVSAFSQSTSTHARVDVSRVDYLDSSGLHMVASLDQIAASRGGRVEVTGASPRVRRVFDLTHLGGHLVDSPTTGAA